jgi:hypothetical protein
MFTVSLSQHGNSTDLQSFATLDEARAFVRQERTRNEDHPDFRKAEWTISDEDGACWHTEEPADLTVYRVGIHGRQMADVEHSEGVSRIALGDDDLKDDQETLTPSGLASITAELIRETGCGNVSWSK